MKTVTVGQLKQIIRERCDQEDSDYIEDPELLRYINIEYAEYYGMITEIYEDYNIASADITVQNNANIYNLPSNFFKMVGVDYNADTDSVVEVGRFQFGERNKLERNFYADAFSTNLRYKLMGDTIVFLPDPPQGKKIRLWYVPASPTLVEDTQLIDGINGYEEMIISGVCVMIANKQEQDAAPFLGAKRSQQKRIRDEAPNRDAGQPARVTDSRSLQSPHFYSNTWRNR